jgi:hypothetical protein
MPDLSKQNIKDENGKLNWIEAPMETLDGFPSLFN